MIIRIATESDIDALREVYKDSVTAMAPRVYSPTQTRSWAGFADDEEEFRKFVLGVTSYLAQRDETIIGFCGIGDDGHVASLYVRDEWSGQGIGSRLLAWALNHARLEAGAQFHAEASEFSLPLFQRFGFTLTGTERVERDGVEFVRYQVRRLT